MIKALRRMQVEAVDRASRLVLLDNYDFIEVRKYRGVPVYAPADAFCREEVFCEAYAFAYGEGIFVEYKTYARDIELMAHELEHVNQLRRWGVMFGPVYWLQNLLVGYERNLFEVGALAVEAQVKKDRALRKKRLSRM